MASLRVPGGPRLPATRAGRPTALRLLLLLGAVLKPQESLAQLLTTPGNLDSENKYPAAAGGWPGARGEAGKVMESYKEKVQRCWQNYTNDMDSIKKDWCDWAIISRPYSLLQYCLESHAEDFDLGFPNPWAEQIIIETHQIHFANCTLVEPTFSDPPEGLLLALIIAPICLIPFLVTLVVWKSKDSEAHT